MNYLTDKKSKALYKALLLLKTERECQNFLVDLLTPVEITELANRFAVAQMLDKKIPYEQITKETGMSSTTIARIQKWLTNGMGGYKLVIKRFKTMKRKTNKTNHHHTPLAAV